MIREWRLERGWSQDQLAEVSGVSVRTIQRIENGQNAGLETWRCLANAFDVSVKDLMPKNIDAAPISADVEVAQAVADARAIRDFLAHLVTYVVLIGLFFCINLLTNSENIWAWWPAIGWGIAVAVHGLSVFEENLFGLAWEKRYAEGKVGRKI